MGEGEGPCGLCAGVVFPIIPDRPCARVDVLDPSSRRQVCIVKGAGLVSERGSFVFVREQEAGLGADAPFPTLPSHFQHPNHSPRHHFPLITLTRPPASDGHQ